jgi:hypothetical protein
LRWYGRYIDDLLLYPVEFFNKCWGKLIEMRILRNHKRGIGKNFGICGNNDDE